MARFIQQRGPRHPERFESVIGTAQEVRFTLPPGVSLDEALDAPLAGFASAAVELRGGTLAPLAYVTTVPSRDSERVVEFGTPFAARGTSRLEQANVTVGRRNGTRGLHCHGFWSEGDAQLRAGHVLTSESIVTSPIEGRAWGLTAVRMESRFDPETNFTLFSPDPSASPPTGGGRPIVVARVRPNEDLAGSFEAIARRHRLTEARVRGGVGSLIGASFEDGRRIEDMCTEAVVLGGEVRTIDGDLRARLEVAIGDMSGRMHRGCLVRGENPVCITFELVIE
jgi:hypothetical protein